MHGLKRLAVVFTAGFAMAAQEPVTVTFLSEYDPDTPEDESAATPTPVPLVRKEGFYTLLLAATDVGGGNTDTIMVAAYYAFVVVTLALGFALDARRAFTYKI